MGKDLNYSLGFREGYNEGERRSAILLKSLMSQFGDKVDAADAVYEWIKQVLKED